ncbi:MAG: hypothetical protein A2W08_17290 [Candidatus Rokubacteria bacterium RBG_16_73_20]|nr:MAG: hypothetical protein A2X52_20975 [Candidatus Rokubacteria bacterium GWC2_70_16]OGK90354.1 MAG: hypothetical protein A2W08_17290 [Candidatus Rokubacteria bacterium RBG_16_73_20]
MSAAVHAHAEAAGAAARGKVAVWWFLASEVMLFGGLISSFVVARLGGAAHAEPGQLNVTVAAINTFILLSSSYTMVEAYAAAERGDRRGMRLLLALTVLGGLAFLGVKAYEYTGEIAHGFTPWAGPFWSFYYTLTGLHALHVLVGVVLNATLCADARLGLGRPYRVELAGLYWHFVDIVWIFLFPLVYLS